MEISLRCAIIASFILLQCALASELLVFNVETEDNEGRQQQVVAVDGRTWKSQFFPNETEVHMGTSFQVGLEIIDMDKTQTNYSFRLVSGNPRLASVAAVIHKNEIDPVSGYWRGNITIEAQLLGSAVIYVEKTNTGERSENVLNLIIVRKQRIIDHVFTGSVALLVSLLYINFGAALDLTVLRGLIQRPIGPLIGFLTQFLVMPVLSYGLGCAIFPNADQVEMQLGLFFTGVSPSGGASNIWTVILEGNINLSVLMTTIGNFAAFLTMPLWLFTLGHVIFERGDIGIPYTNIATFAVSLVVPLLIGLVIQKKSERITRILVRLLKPICSCLIIFIVVFAIVTNLYLFELFSWQIAVAGLALPWLGYILAWCLSKLFRQNAADALTIAIETGIQNTGIAIFLLRFTLPQPAADLTTIIPVAVAIMTPLPLLGIYLFKRCTARGIKYGITEEQHRQQRP